MAAVSRIIEDPHTKTNDRIHAHVLMLDCIDTKQRLISDATIVQEALAIVEQTRQRLVELNPPSLVDSTTSTTTAATAEVIKDEEEEAAPTTKQQQEEESEHQEKEQQKTNNSIF